MALLLFIWTYFYLKHVFSLVFEYKYYRESYMRSKSELNTANQHAQFIEHNHKCNYIHTAF